MNLLALVNPGMRGLIVRKTMATLGATALQTWRDHVVNEALSTGLVNFYGGSPQEPAQYRYTNGSVVVIGGMDKASKIMSSEYDAVYVQEATELTENDWEHLNTRLRNGKISFQQLIADCNPDAPHHWLRKRTNNGKTTILESRHNDNPLLYDEDNNLTSFGADYISKLDQLTGLRKQRLRNGLWVAAEGIIYENYDPAIHVIDMFDIPETWPRYWSIDFGYTNPFVCQWWAEDPDGRLYLYREMYRTKCLVSDAAAGMIAWSEHEPAPLAVVCDHDAEGRAQLERALGGRGTVAATKVVGEGIQAVQGRLSLAGDGLPRLYLLRGALVAPDPDLAGRGKPTCTEEEFLSYIWDTTPGKPPKETPRKENDHGMDTTRYIVAFKDLKPTPNIRWL
jgi:phage terminase large subunit